MGNGGWCKGDIVDSVRKGEKQVLKAELHGKVSEDTSAIERREDILTSSVFGLFEYVECGSLLASFFGEAIGLDGRRWECSGSPRRCRMAFWPWLEEGNGQAGCEPDVLVAIGGEDDVWTIILVEAKYLSGKSGGPVDLEDGLQAEPRRVGDQLAREWVALEACRLERHLNLGGGARIADRALIYLTADHVFPRQELEASVKELARAGCATARSRIFWLSWRRLLPLLASQPAGMPERMLDDLVTLLERRGLRGFRGFRVPLFQGSAPHLFWSAYGQPQRETDSMGWFSSEVGKPIGPGNWWGRRCWDWGGDSIFAASRLRNMPLIFRRSS